MLMQFGLTQFITIIWILLLVPPDAPVTCPSKNMNIKSNIKIYINFKFYIFIYPLYLMVEFSHDAILRECSQRA